MRRALVLLAALSVTVAAHTGEPAAGGDLLTTIGVVNDGREENGELWFELDRVQQRFVLDAETPGLDGIFEALKDSNVTGRSVVVGFDPASGRFDPGLDIPSYVVRSIDYDGRVMAGMDGPRRRVDRDNPAESALARAVAFHASGAEAERVLDALGPALSGDALRPALRSLALRTRGNAISSSIWANRQAPTEEDDRLLVRALQDFRDWAALEPDSFDAQMDIAGVLSDLGAYEEALAAYEAADRRWPEEGIRTTTRIAATYRIQGDDRKALDALDRLARERGPVGGMMFHYHRGWTLIELGRYEEAVTELSAGLAEQPDYPSAFERRACAYARLGRLPEALADFRRANELMQEYLQDAPPTPSSMHERDWSASVIAAMATAVAAGRTSPMSEPCEREWHYGDLRRERSPALPP